MIKCCTVVRVIATVNLSVVISKNYMSEYAVICPVHGTFIDDSEELEKVVWIHFVR